MLCKSIKLVCWGYCDHPVRHIHRYQTEVEWLMANGMGTGHNAMGTHGSGSQWYGNRSHSLVLRPFLKSDISYHMGRTILCTECHNCIYKSGTQFSTATAHTNYYTIARAGCKVFCHLIGDLNTKIVPSPCEKNVSDHSGMGTDHSRHAENKFEQCHLW